jgi:cysteine desulfurase
VAKITPIYADYNATTPLCPPVKKAICNWGNQPGNMSSAHQNGRAMQHIYDASVDSILTQCDAKKYQLLSCSSATEANHWFFHSVLHNVTNCPRVIMSAIEHPSVALSLTHYAIQKKIDLQICRVTPQGYIDTDHLMSLITPTTRLISVIFANNEIGTIQPLKKICKIAQTVGALVHSDAVQAAGKFPLSLDDIGLDAITLSAHKCYAPVGCGVLLVKTINHIQPLFLGGAQQQRLRAGTVNVLGLHCFALGLTYCNIMRPSAPNVHAWATQFCQTHAEVSLVTPLCDTVLWNTVSIAIQNQTAHNTMIALDLVGIMVSTGSACSTGAIEASPVLLAMGHTKETALSVIRISFGYPTTPHELHIIEQQLLNILKPT